MKAPHEKPVIQIDITNACDVRTCSNCTRNLMHHPRKFAMSMENFVAAVESLKDYPGVIGVFGGNPCLHPKFEEFSRWFALAIPERHRRGLWTNHFRGHGDVIREVYGYRNLNVHGDVQAAGEMRAALGPAALIHGEERECWHSPTLVAIQDVIPDKAAMWAAIERCDINLKWSGAITEINGRLSAWFCEVAAGFAHIYQDDSGGLPVTPGWWAQSIDAYSDQVKKWCPQCGVPLRLKGHLDQAETDDVSETHLARIQGQHGDKRRLVVHVTVDGQRTHEATDYMGYRRRNSQEAL